MTQESRSQSNGSPSQVNAERALVGAVILGAPMKELRPLLRSTDFVQPLLGAAYTEALKLEAVGVGVDNVTLAAALERLPMQAGEGSVLDGIGGRAGLQVLVAECPTTRNAKHYAELIARAAAERAGRPAGHRSTRVQVDRVGLGYRAVLAAGVELHFDRIRGSREIAGHLSVTWTHPITPGDGHIYAGNFNASRSWERTNLAKELARSGAMTADAWRDILEGFCVGVLAENHRPPRLIDLTKIGARPTAKTLCGPAGPIGQVSTFMAMEGSGKSTLMRILAVMVRADIEVLGWRPAMSGPVLVIDYEADEFEWAEGIAEIAAGLGIEPPQIDYMPCAMGGALHDQIDAISARVAEIKPVLVIVDSAELAAGAGQENESFEARTQRLYAALKLLGTTVFVVDHLAATERDGSGPASKAYGSVFKMAWSRQVWELKREKAATDERAELLLINAKYNAGAKAKPIGLAFNYAPGRLTVERTDVLAPELQGSLPVYERMTRLLRNGSLTVAALAQELDKSDGYVRQMTSRYKDRFIRLPDGRIGLVNHG
ncbi:MAG: DnaB-like helicase N-terminal domain-containing protein [Candidatus Dormibacteraceae bacterium]